jgi:hypothetical protein
MNTHKQMRAFAVSLSVVLASAAARPVQLPEWRLTRPLSEGERAGVLALAARLNVGEPAVVTSDVINQPLNCDALRIDSVPAVQGNRRTWKRVWVARTGGCPGEQPTAPRVGQWVAADSVREVGAWHISLDGGFLDVETPSTVPYADVAAIVVAVRTGSLVNRLPPEYRGNRRQIPKVDAKAIFVVWNYQQDPALYKVNFRSGNVTMLLAVRGTLVELRGWIEEVS